MKVQLSVALPTSINQLYQNEFKYDQQAKKYLATGKRILTKKGLHTKAMIRKYAKKQLSQQEWDYEYTKAHYIYLDVVIYFERKGSDPDNIFKLLNDSLEGIVFDNDSRVLPRVQKVIYDKGDPHVEATLFPVSYIGIFDNEDQAEVFEEKCQECSRYRKGSCAILKAAKGAYIQPEISKTFECSEYKKRKG